MITKVKYSHPSTPRDGIRVGEIYNVTEKGNKHILHANEDIVFTKKELEMFFTVIERSKKEEKQKKSKEKEN